MVCSVRASAQGARALEAREYSRGRGANRFLNRIDIFRMIQELEKKITEPSTKLAKDDLPQQVGGTLVHEAVKKQDLKKKSAGRLKLSKEEQKEEQKQEEEHRQQFEEEEQLDQELAKMKKIAAGNRSFGGHSQENRKHITARNGVRNSNFGGRGQSQGGQSGAGGASGGGGGNLQFGFGGQNQALGSSEGHDDWTNAGLGIDDVESSGTPTNDFKSQGGNRQLFKKQKAFMKLQRAAAQKTPDLQLPALVSNYRLKGNYFILLFKIYLCN